MEKDAGYVISKHSKRMYPVKWVQDNNAAWISRATNEWQMVCTNVKSTDESRDCVQNFIDSQPELF